MTYEFISSTGNIVERRFSMHDEIPAVVIEDGVPYRRLYRATGVLYKAPGFRATDTADAVTKWQREHLDHY